MTFKYYEPSKDIGPKHTPEKVKNPGKWKYYDIDLDAVREQVSTNVYLGGGVDMTREEWEDKDNFLKLLKIYLDKTKNKKPEIGQYDVKLPEKHLPDIDFDKMQSRAQYYDEDFDADQDKEGDVLILNPHEP